MRSAVFITVRTGSTRLPNKAFLEIQSLPTIVHLIRRVKSVSSDEIVLCTTQLPEDDILEVVAVQEGIRFFRGSTKDKLLRWQGAAGIFGIDYYVTADGDDLFCEPELLELGLQQLKNTDIDFIESSEVICGVFTYGIRVSALNKVCKIKDSEDTEMMWTYFKDTGLFKVGSLTSPPKEFIRDDIRMTLDYEDDFIFFKSIIDHFYKIGRQNFTLRDIIKFLDDNPHVILINKYLHTDWQNNQLANTKLLLKETENG